jgi:uncharacterized protein YPO0396
LVFTGIVALLLLNRQFVIDTVRAAQFTPSAKITAIEGDLALSSEAKRLFAASQPRIEPAEVFNTDCKQASETNNPILGCYTRQTIYIYDVTNPKLDGIEQTTAAHELLHAVYERLPAKDRRVIDGALQQAYERLKTEDLVRRMEFYKKTEPGQELNELHSILGTEFDDLGDVLETHYKKYFTSRSKVVAFNKKYNSAFNEISAKMKQLLESINSSVTVINQRIKTHNQAVKQLEIDQKAFVQKNRSGGFTSTAEFNAEQNALNARAATLNAERTRISEAIDVSNRERDEYNTLVNEYNELSKSMNSSLAPKPDL